MSALSPLHADADGALSPRSSDVSALVRPNDDDSVLVGAALAGDRAAEEALYRRHAPAVLGLARRLLGSREDAMDVLQDAFIVAFEDLRDLREPAAFRSWVRRIAVRFVHRRFRRRKLLRLIGLDGGTPDAALEAIADESICPEARVELGWIDVALGRVDASSRVAWVLRHVEGLSLEEVAAACECSLATAKRRIAAADVVVARHLADGRGGVS